MLLSLGVYTYAEYTLRKALAWRLDACVLPYECKDCSHVYKSVSTNGISTIHNYSQGYFLTRFINVTFMALAMFHLLYLGACFTDDEAAQADQVQRSVL